ncbi:hypothetical protein [Aquabacterium sp. CECT 9606]|uniref:hypothetical protein n=1 Tax=Aquabacterium sp. CECT 9606 TaxID=2845822 RepID=UPI001E56141B|nr:hypothetical protein [Aquabacterium sp. CECT 9606]CAH0348745.1 hypothetical protein AQB9606_00717 [Aquabacterium sp. CECT 9606]
MKKWGLIAGLLVASVAVATFVALDHGAPAESNADPNPMNVLPWHIEPLPSGDTQVFGLRLSARPEAASTLGDVQRRWASDFQMAVVAAPGETGSLEAYVETATMGFIIGKLVVTAQLGPQVINGFRERAAKVDYMNSSTRKYRLSPEDQALALRAPILALAFIPQANLDEDIVKARFGMPAERVRSNAHAEHWLYPDKGLGITLDSEGKELLQYVAPAQFMRLREPLRTPAKVQ